MNSKIVIRSETDADSGAITDVTVAMFQSLEISRHTKHFVVAGLRTAGALSLWLVAEVENRVVGHVAFSPLAVSDGTPDWYGLGSLSVLPEYQC